jgi:hypothetical protein
MRHWREAACPAALNGLAVAREHLGRSTRLLRVVRLGSSAADERGKAALKGQSTKF